MEAQGFFRSIGQGARGGRANASLGFRVELRRDDLLVFSIEDTVIDDRAAETLERVWPGWRECVSD